MFFIIEKSEKASCEFSLNSVSIKYNGNTQEDKSVELFKQWRI